jgi:uncharacterized glyoxalase superfamily protein PhnB
MTQTTPPASPRIFPALRYRDARAAITWLTTAFGFEPQAVFDAPDGGIAHAELRFGSGVIGLNSAGAIDPANPWTQVTQGIYVQIQTVDQHHDRARAAGAAIVRALKDESYGSRDYSARDSEGHLWDFGTYAMGAPAGPPDLFVALHYDDGVTALGFLEQAFGFVTTLSVPGENGTIAHAEARLGDGMVMVGSTPRNSGFWGDQRQCVYLVVPDVDGHFARAEAGGATIVRPVVDTAHGSREYAARDPEGFLWSFGTYRPGQ